MKAIIIARVSDKKQDSNEAQVNRVSDYVKSKEFSPVTTYEIEESSTHGDRLKFQAIIEEIRQSKEPVAIVVDTIDRLQRSFKESVELDDLRKLGKIELHFYREGLIIHKDSNSSDLLRWDMGVMFARSYVLQLSDNVKRKQEQMLRNGEYPTKPPYGYKRVPISKDKTEIVVDDYASRIVQKVYEWYATSSYSMELIRQKLTKDYALNWSKGFLDKVLKDHFYYGIMTWNKKTYPHKYIPIITKLLFDQVQQIKAGFHKKPFKYAGKPYVYRGLLRCGHCGCAITPEKHKGIVYYHCTQYYGKHEAKWLTEADMTKQIGNVFKRLQLPNDILKQVLGVLQNSHEGKVEFRDLQYAELTKEHELYTKRLEQIYLDKLDGRITPPEYDNYHQSFRDKIADVDTRIGMLQEAEDNYYITASYLVEFAQKAYELFKSSEVEERRQLIKLTLSNLRVEGEFVRYEVVKPYNAILNYADRQAWLPGVDSNRRPCS
ncbi:MAG: cassette chromosome recombinase B [uncultured bacterium]|nr:MAG: cassette chromosome recombinase B [uncultured bacterium]